MEKEAFQRTILTYKNYFSDFYKSQTPDVKEKIAHVLKYVRELRFIPSQYFKHIENTDGIYEVRVEYESKIYRIFCFFDKGNLIILGNAFQKKTQKTPQKEVKTAIQIRKEYFNEKE